MTVTFLPVDTTRGSRMKFLHVKPITHVIRSLSSVSGLNVTATGPVLLYTGYAFVGFGCATLVPSAFAAAARLPGMTEGMFGRLLIPAGERRHLCLPTAAIEHIGQLEMVDVVKPDGTIERRQVKTGRLGMKDRVEVLSGVRAGEQVLLKSAPGGGVSREP